MDILIELNRNLSLPQIEEEENEEEDGFWGAGAPDLGAVHR